MKDIKEKYIKEFEETFSNVNSGVDHYGAYCQIRGIMERMADEIIAKNNSLNL